MLDESKHASYYDVYMQQHPEDKMPKIVDLLVGEFAESLQKDRINILDCITDGKVNYNILDSMKEKIKHPYLWDRIKAQVYAAIVSRMSAILQKSKNQRYNENEIEFDDVVHGVSRRTIEDCLDIVCHNTNVLSANTELMADPDKFAEFFKKHGVPEVETTNDFKGKQSKYSVVAEVYSAWASYATGKYGEKYVCDSHNGPAALINVLNETEYSADDVDLAVMLNKALDIVHARSDLAAAFIEGGQHTCALVSSLPDKFVI